jgi:Tol biopolymer transport system component
MKNIPRTVFVLFFTVAAFLFEVSGQVPAAHVEHMLVVRNTTLYVMEANGANRRKIAEEVSTAALSPESDLVVYADPKGIKVFDLRTVKTSTLVNAPAQDIRYVTWSPKQDAVAYSNAIPDKGVFLHLIAYPPSGPPRVLGPTYGGISFSKDGNFILHATTAGGRGALEKTDVESGKTETLFSSKTLIERASYSSDDSQIAFLLIDKAPDSEDDEPDCGPPSVSLWILPAHSKTPAKASLKRLGDPDINEFSWSPKDNLLVFDSGRLQCDFPGSEGDIYVVSPDMKTAFKLSKHALSIRPIFSPDGQTVLFSDFSVYDDGHGANLMIGDLRTRTVKPFLGQSPSGKGDSVDYDQVVDWK